MTKWSFSKKDQVYLQHTCNDHEELNPAADSARPGDINNF